MGQGVAQVSEGEVQRARQDVGDGQWRTAVRYTDRVQSSLFAQGCQGDLRAGGPIPAIDLAGPLLHVGIEFPRHPGRKVRLDHQGCDAVGDARHQCQILRQVVRHGFQQGHVGCQ